MRTLCHLCPDVKLAPKYRVTFGSYAGSWYVCEAHLQKLLTDQLHELVVVSGLRCVIEEIEAVRDLSMLRGWRDRTVAVISRRAAS